MNNKKYMSYVIMSIMESTFSNWILQELDKRGWSQSDLARASGLTRGGVSNIVNEKSSIGIDSATGIAKAFGVPVTEVLSAAGVIPKMPEATAEEEQLLYLFRQLSDYDREAVLNFVEFTSRRK